MDSTVNSGTLIVTTIIQVIFTIIVFGLLYFAAYKPIKRMINKYFQQNDKKTRELDNKSTIEAKRELIDIIGEANKKMQDLEDEIAQTQTKVQKSEKEEERKILESIINKTHKTIGKERDSALKEIRREYNDLTLRSKDDSINLKGERKDHEN